MAKFRCLLPDPIKTLGLVVSGIAFFFIGVGCEKRAEYPSSQNAFQADNDLIEGGRRVGQLALGDSRDHAFAVFPFKTESDQKFKSSNCGEEYLWTEREAGKGNVFIRIESGRVFQIEVATPRFRTKEGLTTRSSPEEIRRSYEDLRSYALMGKFSEALGGLPLIFLGGSLEGIGFLVRGGAANPKPLSVFDYRIRSKWEILS